MAEYERKKPKSLLLGRLMYLSDMPPPDNFDGSLVRLSSEQKVHKKVKLQTAICKLLSAICYLLSAICRTAQAPPGTREFERWNNRSNVHSSYDEDSGIASQSE